MKAKSVLPKLPKTGASYIELAHTLIKKQGYAVLAGVYANDPLYEVGSRISNLWGIEFFGYIPRLRVIAKGSLRDWNRQLKLVSEMYSNKTQTFKPGHAHFVRIGFPLRKRLKAKAAE